MLVEVHEHDPVGVVGDGGEPVFEMVRGGAEQDRFALVRVEEDFVSRQNVREGFIHGSGFRRFGRAIVRRRRVHDHQDVLTRRLQIAHVMIEPPFQQIRAFCTRSRDPREEEHARVRGVEERLAVGGGVERARGTRERPARDRSVVETPRERRVVVVRTQHDRRVFSRRSSAAPILPSSAARLRGRPDPARVAGAAGARFPRAGTAPRLVPQRRRRAQQPPRAGRFDLPLPEHRGQVRRVVVPRPHAVLTEVRGERQGVEQHDHRQHARHHAHGLAVASSDRRLLRRGHRGVQLGVDRPASDGVASRRTPARRGTPVATHGDAARSPAPRATRPTPGRPSPARPPRTREPRRARVTRAARNGARTRVSPVGAPESQSVAFRRPPVQRPVADRARGATVSRTGGGQRAREKRGFLSRSARPVREIRQKTLEENCTRQEERNVSHRLPQR